MEGLLVALEAGPRLLGRVPFAPHHVWQVTERAPDKQQSRLSWWGGATHLGNDLFGTAAVPAER